MVLFVLGFVLVSQASLAGQEKDTPKENNSIAALFDGIPADLRSKVKDNPVRIDRVNDWVQEKVTGKLKPIEIKMRVKEIYLPARSEDRTYTVLFSLEYAKVNVLGDEWEVSVHPAGPAPGGRFSFVGVSTADAEKLLDSKTILIQGRAKYVRLIGGSGSYGPFAEPRIGVSLEDVQVDGKTWTPAPFIGGFKGKKEGGLPPAKDKKAKKGADM